MIRINLLPREERVSVRKISLPKMSGAVIPVAGLGVALLVVGIFAALERGKVSALRSDVAEIRAEVRAIQPQVDRVKKLTAQREELERRLDIIRQLDEGRFLSVRVMDNMSREVPRYLWLTGLKQNGVSRVAMNGVTFSNLIVADFMMRVERSPLFSNVDLVHTQMGEIDDRKVMEFSISADLTPNEVPSDFSAEAFFDDLLRGER